jgi:hypothetical protein
MLGIVLKQSNVPYVLKQGQFVHIRIKNMYKGEFYILNMPFIFIKCCAFSYLMGIFVMLHPKCKRSDCMYGNVTGV